MKYKYSRKQIAEMIEKCGYIFGESLIEKLTAIKPSTASSKNTCWVCEGRGCLKCTKYEPLTNPTPPKEDKCEHNWYMDRDVGEVLCSNCGMVSTPIKVEGERWKYKCRRMFGKVKIKVNTLEGGTTYINVCDDIVRFIKITMQSQHSHLLSTLGRRMKKLKIPIQPKYDGNNLKEACDRYGIGALNWTEIVRYEDGYNTALNDILVLLSSMEEKL